MKRREFIAGLGGAVAWPLLVSAQQPTKPTIGYLGLTPGPTNTVAPACSARRAMGNAPSSSEYVEVWLDIIEGIRRGLAEAGFSEGRDWTLARRALRARTAIR